MPGGAPSAIPRATPRVPSRPGRSRLPARFCLGAGLGLSRPLQDIGDGRRALGASSRHCSVPRRGHCLGRGADLALLAARCRQSHWRPRPNPGLRTFRLVQHEWARTGGCTCGTSGLGAQGSRAAASTTSRLSHPVSPRLPRRAVRPRRALLLLHLLLQCPTRKMALSLPGKGPDLRKLVAGAGFEPATSGL